MDPMPKLSCERCKRRKIRCDKGNPCSNCASSGSKCDAVQRARLPRGRSVKAKKTALEERVARLESLLKQVPSSDADVTNGSVPASTQSQTKDRASSFIAPEFWTKLSGEVAGLRETLDDSDDDQLDEPEIPGHAFEDTHLTSGMILFGPSPFQNDSRSSSNLPKPSGGFQNLLFELYHDRVDALYKLLHWPTTVSNVAQTKSRNGAFNSSPYAALENSIYFMALCSITDAEAEYMGLGDRVSLVEQYRSLTEEAISRASLLQQPTVTVLQAFIIYLLGYRTFYNSATAWTLLAVAVRAGTALRLGQEDTKTIDAFELQIRRRLWYSIALIDTHASFDRGTVPMVQWKDLGPPPLLLNDAEMNPDMVPTVSSPHFNDMSFFAITLRAMVIHKKMMSTTGSPEFVWSTNSQMVADFERSLEAEYGHFGEQATLLERFAGHAAKGVVAGMHLVLRRPPYKQPVELTPPSDDFDVLSYATYLLQADMRKDSPEYAMWSWKSWVPWHVLAVVLAELCSRPWTEDHELSYSVAVEAFHKYADQVADSNKGMLWRPIAKLMHQLQKIRQSATPVSNPSTTSSMMNEVENARYHDSDLRSLSKATDNMTMIPPDLEAIAPNMTWANSNGHQSFFDDGNESSTTYLDPQFGWTSLMDYATDMGNVLY